MNYIMSCSEPNDLPTQCYFVTALALCEPELKIPCMWLDWGLVYFFVATSKKGNYQKMRHIFCLLIHSERVCFKGSDVTEMGC